MSRLELSKDRIRVFKEAVSEIEPDVEVLNASNSDSMAILDCSTKKLR